MSDLFLLKNLQIIDLFEIYRELFGLEYELGIPRISEKIHESMFSVEEASRVKANNGYYIMHYKDVYNESLPFTDFSSDKVVVDKNELNNILNSYEYFNPRP